MLTIPLDPIPSQEFTITLNGQNCRIFLYWRQGRLFADLSVNIDDEDKIVTEGAICMNRANIIQHKTSLFSGGLYFYDTYADEEPQFQDLGTRYILLYFAEDEAFPDSWWYVESEF